MSPFQKGDISRNLTFPEMSPSQKCHLSFPTPFLSLTFPSPFLSLTSPFSHLSLTFPFFSPFPCKKSSFPCRSHEFGLSKSDSVRGDASLAYSNYQKVMFKVTPVWRILITKKCCPFHYTPVWRILITWSVLMWFAWALVRSENNSDSVRGDDSLVSTNSVIRVYCLQMQGWRQFGVTCSVSTKSYAMLAVSLCCPGH